MNKAAQALGRLGKGIKKTGLSPSEIERRRNQARLNLEQIQRNRELAKLVSSNVSKG